jgi:hypothetical protein
MALAVGPRLGPYEIAGAIGAAPSNSEAPSVKEG